MSTATRDATAADLIADRIVRLSEIRIDPEKMAISESSYRRGVHQALGVAYDLVEQGANLGDALRILARAERLAGELRYRRKDQGNGMLLDTIKQRLAPRRKPARTGSH